MTAGESLAELVRTAAAVATGLVAAATLIGAVRGIWRRTFGRSRHATRRLLRLAALYRVEFFESMLGPAAMKTSVELDSDTDDLLSGKLSEWIWIDRLFFVQAVTSGDGTVLRWAVTSRRKRFSPVFRPVAGARRPRVRLNKTPLAELGTEEEIQQRYCSIGAHNWWYWERFYFGNPGGYQDFYQGINALGWSSGESIAEMSGIEIPSESDDDLVRTFRRKTCPNTYSESVNAASDPFDIGPSMDSVRLLLKWTPLEKFRMLRAEWWFDLKQRLKSRLRGTKQD